MQGCESSALFVYGTLMRGRPAHGLVAPWVRAVWPATLPGRLFEMPEGYPALVADEAAGPVFGEVLELAGDVPWPRLDEYEGHDPADPDGSLYLREERGVALVAGGTQRAWCYLMPGSAAPGWVARGARPLPGGRWPPAPAGR